MEKSYQLERHLILTGVIAFATCFIGAASASAQSSAEVLSGRTLNVMVGFSNTGSGAKVWKLLSKTLRQKLPNTVIRTRFSDGAAGISQTNTMFKDADDALHIAFVRPPELAFAQMSKQNGTVFDLRKANWLIGLEEPSVVMAARRGLNIDLKNLRTSQKLFLMPVNDKLSVTGRVSVLLGAATGIPSKIVVGFGRSDRRKSLLAGDVDMAPLGLDHKSLPLLKSGDIQIVYKLSGTDLPSEFAQIPNVDQFWQADVPKSLVNQIVSARGMGRAFFTPPNTNERDVKALRAVLAETLSDQNLQTESKKRRIIINPVDYATVTKDVESLFPKSEADGIALQNAYECGLQMSLGKTKKCAF